MDPLITEAVALWRAGRHQDAERACTAALASSDDQIDARGLLAEIYSSVGRNDQAVEQLRRIAELRPNDAPAHRRLGDALFATKDFEASAASFQRAIAIEPGHPRAHNNLGRALAQLGDRAAAIRNYRQAIALDPSYAIAYNNLGIELVESGELEEASACYARAAAVFPKLAASHCNQGNLLLRLKRADEALACYERALTLDPRNAIVHCNQGNALRELRRLEDALASCNRALAIQPDHVDALSNKADILFDLGRAEEAVACCDQLLLRTPEFPPALLCRGLALKDLGRYEDSVDSFARLMRADPGRRYTPSYLLFVSSHACDWSHASLIAEGIRDSCAGKPSITPLTSLALTDAADVQLQSARTYVTLTRPPASTPLWTGETRHHEKIKVAYLSADLRDHALSYLMAGVFEKHDRSRFETIGVSFQRPTNSPFGLRVKTAFDVFMDVREQSDAQVAQQLHRVEIDIAVDLMGFTRGERLNIFARRFAPLQIAYLGYPGTSGAPYIDYLIADDFVVPHDNREHYSEAVVYLPDCFQANDDRRVISEPGPDRAQAGLPEAAFVFCSFNNCYKITPPVFEVWCRLLRARQDSVLWLLADSEVARRNLRQTAADRGVDPNRLVFAGRVRYEDHLARLRLADLFLDTFPFNAGTTASDALWAGLPLVTCSGQAFASRMAGSLLRAIGLTELVTASIDDYERLALRLASVPGELTALRTRLAANRTTHALFMTERFCRHLEAAYTTMYERHRGGLPAESFSVPPLPALPAIPRTNP